MKINCPSCKHVIDFASFEGTEVACSNCQEMVSILDVLTFTRNQSDINAGRFKASKSPRTDLQPGMRIAHFNLIRELGAGAFGTVFEAYDTRLERHVALKIPNVSVFTEQQATTFIREARAAAQIRDPNIVSVFEVGRHDEHVYIVSELIDGQSLTEWRLEKERSIDDLVQVVCTLAHSVQKAHNADVVHRDLKPANILVDEEGSPSITDFGLAIRSSSSDATVGRPGMIIGTPAYMSPEQARGAPQHADHRSDIFSLGVILYELLTNQRPFKNSDTTSMFDAISRGQFTPLSQLCKGLNPDVEAICNKALALSPDERYQKAEDLALDLEQFLARRPVAARPVGNLEKVAYFFRRNTVSTTFASLAVGLVAWAILFLLFKPGQEVPLTAIEFSVMPPNASVTMVPVNMDGNGLDETTVYEVEPDAQGRCTTELPSKLYLIRIESEFCVQEVYRVVPSDPTERRELGFLATEWEFDPISERIQLKPIEMKRLTGAGTTTMLGELAMTRVPAGKFDGGTDSIVSYVDTRYRELFPIASYDVDEFYMTRDEVSAAVFFEVTGRYPSVLGRGQSSGGTTNGLARGVTWLEAVDFAERVGGRLPKFVEYQFAATNGGTTRYPTGDMKPESFPGDSSEDLTRHVPPIQGLYSSLGEWIWECKFVNFARSESVMPNPLFSTSGPDSRLIVGIPRGFLGEEIFLADEDDPSVVLSQNRSIKSKRIGFRVVYVAK